MHAPAPTLGNYERMEEGLRAALCCSRSTQHQDSGRRHAKDTATILKNDWGHNVFFSLFIPNRADSLSIYFGCNQLAVYNGGYKSLLDSPIP